MTQIVFGPDRSLMVTTSWDRTAKVWSLPGGSLVGSPLIHQGHVHRAAFSSDSRFLATAQADGLVRVWKRPAGRPADHKIPANPTNNVAVLSADGRNVVASRFSFFGWGTNGNQVRVHDVATGWPLGPAIQRDGIDPRSGPVTDRDGVAVAYEVRAENTGGRLAVHDFLSGAGRVRPDRATRIARGHRLQSRWEEPRHLLPGWTRDLDRDGRRPGDPSTATLKRATGRRTSNQRVLYTPDGTSLVTLGEDKTVMVWDLAAPRRDSRRLRWSVSDVDISPRRPSTRLRYQYRRDELPDGLGLADGPASLDGDDPPRRDLPGEVQPRRTTGSDRSP